MSILMMVAAPSIVAQSVSAPMFAPLSGESATATQVTVTCATPGAVIRYTTHGADPVPGDPVVVSGTPIAIKRSCLLKAKAWLGDVSGATSSATFEITGGASAGGKHILLLKSSGEVWAWGNQNDGRLGNGSTIDDDLLTSPVPSRIADGLPIVSGQSVAAGAQHSVWIDGSRAVWAFGSNGEGEIGNNTSGNEWLYATRVMRSATPGDWLTDCVQAAAGKSFSAALAASGHVYTWGARDDGRLGRPLADSAHRKFAGRVRTINTGNPELSGINRVDLGKQFGVACEQNALDATGALGQVWTWGANGYGQLGNGGVVSNTTSNPYASRVKLNATTYLTDAWDVSAGDFHTAVVRWKTGDPQLQGSVWTFGNRADGRLGDNGSTSGYAAYPVRVVTSNGAGGFSPLMGIQQVSVGSEHSLALDGQGGVWAWGDNSRGELGDGTISPRNFAGRVKNPSGTGSLGNIVQISAGSLDGTDGFSMAIAADGKVYVWGGNSSAQLSRGTNSGYSALPVEVAIKAQPGFPQASLAVTVPKPTAPGTAMLTATVSDPDGPNNIQKVDYYVHGTLAGTRSASPWNWSLTNLDPGGYHAYAIATDIQGNVGASLPIDFVIHPNPDSDNDGLLDAWETQWFGNLTSQSAQGDADGDKVTNAIEWLKGTNPQNASDSDADGLPDDWEIQWFSATTPTGTQDFDGDRVTNLHEWRQATSPVSFTDEDRDGLSDEWEIYWFSDVGRQDGSHDTDGDKISDALEWSLNTEPLNAQDFDTDGLPDDWEARWFAQVGATTGVDDSDGDRVTNAQEWTQDTMPVSNADADSDGLPDDWEIWRLHDTTPFGGTDDPDADKVTNAQEWQKDTDPMKAKDVDGDDLPDDWEVCWMPSIDACNPADDPDSDKVSTLQEWTQGSPPTSNVDSDSDGLPDDWETSWFGSVSLYDGSGDFDGDGISNINEFAGDSNPNANANVPIDSDEDGISDDWEARFGLSNQSAGDAGLDPDADGLSNYEEYHVGTHPIESDTDADGISDQQELDEGSDPGLVRMKDFRESRNSDGTVTYTWRSPAKSGDPFRILNLQPDGIWKVVFRTTYGSARLPVVQDSNNYKLTLNPEVDYLP